MVFAIGVHGAYKIYQQWYTQVDVASNHSHAGWVGMLHGLAGAAPLLTLITPTQQWSALTGVIYVAFFCFGVSLAMIGLVWSVGLGVTQTHRYQFSLGYLLQITFSFFAIALGIYLLIKK